MNKEEILKWFGNCDNFVACESKEEADQIVNILKECGLRQGSWSAGGTERFWGIKVSGGIIHAYAKTHRCYSEGTSFGDFMAAFVYPVDVEDLI